MTTIALLQAELAEAETKLSELKEHVVAATDRRNELNNQLAKLVREEAARVLREETPEGTVVWTDDSKGFATRGECIIAGRKVSISADRSWETRRSNKKTRIYVSGEEAVDFTEAHAMQKANLEAGITEHPEEDKLFAQLNRIVVKNMKEHADPVIGAELFDDIFCNSIEDFKMNFSRTAGCACGCSSGFVANLQLEVKHNELYYAVTSIWIS